ncbi:MAG: DUF853 domain-containing protein [Bacteroidales bacterium]|nr:DUF853 domain-containing protein [Bacteroidales bacterium]
MFLNNELYVANADGSKLCINGKMANRHGLIAGATGTGKTVTLQVIAESFSQAGVPCFMADMKGDLSGISKTGKLSGFIEKRKDGFGIPDPQFAPCPVRFFDVFAEQGEPIKTTISTMGPQLLSRLMELNDTQSGVLAIAFQIAEDENLNLITVEDLSSLLNYIGQNAKEYTTKYGNITSASVGAIQRALLAIKSEGAENFFGLPAFNVNDFIRTKDGKGIMNVLAADKLMLKPKLYSTFLLWLLTELYQTLPEVGDMDLPKLVFFFDEAHMLFEDTSKQLVDKIEQIVRLIRSKGVGVYFITQSPNDIPEDILGQLGNRVQHALRAFTPKDQKAVKTAADTFRANPKFKTDEAIMNLETGEALVSFLDANGAPSVVERAKILFPLSQIGAITPEERAAFMAEYKQNTPAPAENTEGASSVLSKRNAEADKAAEAATAEKERIAAEKQAEKERIAAEKEAAKQKKEEERLAKEKKKEEEKRHKETMKTVNSVTKALGLPSLLRTIVKSFFKK